DADRRCAYRPQLNRHRSRARIPLAGCRSVCGIGWTGPKAFHDLGLRARVVARQRGLTVLFEHGPDYPVEPNDTELAQDAEEELETRPVEPTSVPALTLQDALADFHSRPTQAANRMVALQNLAAKTLFDRGLRLGDFVLEQNVPGKHRTKKWDVVY